MKCYSKVPQMQVVYLNFLKDFGAPNSIHRFPRFAFQHLICNLYSTWQLTCQRQRLKRNACNTLLDKYRVKNTKTIHGHHTTRDHFDKVPFPLPNGICEQYRWTSNEHALYNTGSDMISVRPSFMRRNTSCRKKRNKNLTKFDRQN